MDIPQTVGMVLVKSPGVKRPAFRIVDMPTSLMASRDALALA